MRILVEECSYEPSILKGVLPEGRLLLTGDKVKIEHVGYLRSAACDDFVFFLPKVVLEPKTDPETGKTENLVLGKYRPEDLVNLDSFNVEQKDEEYSTTGKCWGMAPKAGGFNPSASYAPAKLPRSGRYACCADGTTEAEVEPGTAGGEEGEVNGSA